MKKRCLFCFVLLLLTSFLALRGVALGDPNGDGTIDVKDYMALKRYVLGTLEPNTYQFCRADVNLDGKLNAADYMLLKRVALGTASLPTVDPNADPDSLSDKELQRYVNASLACKRAEGEIIVFFEEGVGAEDAMGIFASAGLPSDLGDGSVYLYRSDADPALRFEKLWFTVRVSEAEIREVMFALNRDASVSSVSPNYTGTWN